MLEQEALTASVDCQWVKMIVLRWEPASGMNGPGCPATVFVNGAEPLRRVRLRSVAATDAPQERMPVILTFRNWKSRVPQLRNACVIVNVNFSQ